MHIHVSVRGPSQSRTHSRCGVFLRVSDTRVWTLILYHAFPALQCLGPYDERVLQSVYPFVRLAGASASRTAAHRTAEGAVGVCEQSGEQWDISQISPMIHVTWANCVRVREHKREFTLAFF